MNDILKLEKQMNKRNFLQSLFGGFIGFFTANSLKAETPIATVRNLTPGELIKYKRPKIRLWKLGSLEHKLYPSSEAISKLAKILSKPTDGDLDIIWGPDLEVISVEGNPEDIDIIETPDGKVIKIKKE